MKGFWAVLLLAIAAAAGCRSSQPTTNPFLRTTVPPPGTGQGAVIVPGEPYYPGTTPPPAVTTDPAIPVVPAPAAAGPPAVLTPAPPPKPPRDLKHPPGGSYLYNQS